MFKFLTPPKTDGQVLKLKLSGLHCTSCALNIDATLEEIAGIKAVSTSYAKSVCTITFDPTQTNAQDITKEIKKLGYDVDSLE